MRQDIIDLYDAYTHERLDRHLHGPAGQAGRRLSRGRGAAPLLRANHAKAAIVPPDDARVGPDRSRFEGSATGEMQAYLVRPADAQGRSPGWS